MPPGRLEQDFLPHHPAFRFSTTWGFMEFFLPSDGLEVGSILRSYFVVDCGAEATRVDQILRVRGEGMKRP